MVNLGGLNPQQRLAVETIRGPVLILAGAGTGKTRVITTRIAHMIACGIPRNQILAVTFTNKAAREMKQRVAKLVPRLGSKPQQRASRTDSPLTPTFAEPLVGRPALSPLRGEGETGPTLCTFHSLGARILRQHIEKLGYKRNFVIYDETEQLGAVKKILSHISNKGENVDPKQVLAYLSRLKSGTTNGNASEDDRLAALAQHILSRYESALRACNAIDFDDLLVLVLKLFKEHSEVLAACRERFRYVMVDEYQDTNAAQFELVHLLTCEHRNLCVVGDDDQSIYAWRGAEIANLLDLEKHFPEVKVVTLEQNYRSTNIILEAASAVIRNNARRRKKQLWSDKGRGEKIVLHEFETDEEEAQTIVEEIEFARVTRRVPWDRQAILFRTNQQSRVLEMALRKSNIRYHLVGGQSFFDRREVRDLLAYLKMFLNPQDDISLLRIANVPARGLSDTTMERLLSASPERNCSVYSAMRHTDVQAMFATKTRESIVAFLEFIERRRSQLQTDQPSPLAVWAASFIEEIGYTSDLHRSEKNPETAENRVFNLNELIATLDRAGDSPASPMERLESFLEDITLDTEREEETESKADAVTLITIHSCKGLEFPHVYVVGLEDGLLPHSRSKQEGTIDEERRLFYVAITRAQQTLTLSYALGRKKYGEVVPCHPSPFLKELPEDLVDHADVRARQPVSVATGKNLFATILDSLG